MIIFFAFIPLSKDTIAFTSFFFLPSEASRKQAELRNSRGAKLEAGSG
jgi:hypothetical protein